MATDGGNNQSAGFRMSLEALSRLGGSTFRTQQSGSSSYELTWTRIVEPPPIDIEAKFSRTGNTNIEVLFAWNGRFVCPEGDSKPEEAFHLVTGLLFALQQIAKSRGTIARLAKSVLNTNPPETVFLSAYSTNGNLDWRAFFTNERLTTLEQWLKGDHSAGQAEYDPKATKELYRIDVRLVPLDFVQLLVSESPTSDLTSKTLPSESRQVKDKRESQGKPETASGVEGHKANIANRPSDPLAELHALAAPRDVPPEIVRLEQILATARNVPANQMQAFVNDVNAILEQASYCFQLAPDNAISRKLYFNPNTSRDGDIIFRLTSGTSRGYQKTEFKLIPYVRPYRRNHA